MIMASTMEGGNLTEELSLPFLFIPLYFALRYIKANEEIHKPIYAMIYGICFGVLMLIRITNSVMICAIILTISVDLMRHGEWKNLLQNAGMFLLGIVLAFLPPVLYFACYDAVKEMLYCTFVFGVIYGTEGFGYGSGIGMLPLLLFPVIIFVWSGEKNDKLWLLACGNIAGMLITLGMGNSTLHDYLLVIPGMMLGWWKLCGMDFQDLKKMKNSGIIIAVSMSAAVFLFPCYKLLRTGMDVAAIAQDKSVYQDTVEVMNLLPDEDSKSVLGYEVPMRWYAISDIMPSSRYCGWQEHYMELSPEIEEEMLDMMKNNPPEWIVTKAADVVKNKKILSVLQEKYQMVLENEHYRLYRQEVFKK